LGRVSGNGGVEIGNILKMLKFIKTYPLPAILPTIVIVAYVAISLFSPYIKQRFSIDISFLFNNVKGFLVVATVCLLFYLFAAKPEDYMVFAVFLILILFFALGLSAIMHQETQTDSKNMYSECIESNKNREVKDIKQLCDALLSDYNN
jgi:hypothetical protein